MPDTTEEDALLNAVREARPARFNDYTRPNSITATNRVLNNG